MLSLGPTGLFLAHPVYYVELFRTVGTTMMQRILTENQRIRITRVGLYKIYKI